MRPRIPELRGLKRRVEHGWRVPAAQLAADAAGDLPPIGSASALDVVASDARDGSIAGEHWIGKEPRTECDLFGRGGIAGRLGSDERQRLPFDSAHDDRRLHGLGWNGKGRNGEGPVSARADQRQPANHGKLKGEGENPQAEASRQK